MATPTLRTTEYIESLTVNQIKYLSAETGDTLFFVGNELTTLPAGPAGQVVTSAGPGLPLIFSPPVGTGGSGTGAVEATAIKTDSISFNTDSKVRLASKTIVDWLPSTVEYTGGTTGPSTALRVTAINSGEIYVGMPVNAVSVAPSGRTIAAFGIPQTAAIGYIGTFVTNVMTGLPELVSGNIFTRLTPQMVTLSLAGTLPVGTLSINESTQNFPTSGTIQVPTNLGLQIVNYTALTPTSFVGCSGGVGDFSVGGPITIQPIIIGTTITEINGGIVATATVVSVNFSGTEYTLDKSLVVEESTMIFTGSASGGLGLYTLDNLSNFATPTSFKSPADPGITYLNNMFWGQGSGTNATMGMQNTSIGMNSLEDLTQGDDNTAVGYNALSSLTGTLLVDGFENTAVGSLAMQNTTTGSRNTANGYQTLISNTVENDNTAIGCLSMQNNTASNNTAVGSLSMMNNTTGTGNIAFGFSTLKTNTTGMDNMAIGQNALESLDGGNDNMAIGNMALNMATTASENTAIGNNSLITLLTGANNTSVGNNSLCSVTTGSNNTAVGNSALEFGDITDATAIGYAAAQNGGNETTAVGAWSLTNNIPSLAITCALAAPAFLPIPIIDVSTTVGWPAAGVFNAQTSLGIEVISYDGITATQFLNCSGGIGLLSGGNAITAGGINNTAVGWSALNGNITGCGNTAIGNNSMVAGTGSCDNTAVGFDTLSSTFVGSQFNAFGTGALASAIGSNGASVVGSTIGTVGTNTGVVNNMTTTPFTLTVTSTAGFKPSGTVIAGSQKVTYTGITATTFTGAIAEFNAVLNIGEIVTSDESILTVTSINYGTLFIGQTIAGNSIAVGTKIIRLGTGTGGIGTYIVTNNQNVASTTIFAKSTGSNAVGSFALTNLTSGMNNVGMGNSAGISLLTGNSNIIIGNQADVLNDIDGAVVIGSGATTGDATRALSLNINPASVVSGNSISCLINGNPEVINISTPSPPTTSVTMGGGVTGPSNACTVVGPVGMTGEVIGTNNAMIIWPANAFDPGVNTNTYGPMRIFQQYGKKIYQTRIFYGSGPITLVGSFPINQPNQPGVSQYSGFSITICYVTATNGGPNALAPMYSTGSHVSEIHFQYNNGAADRRVVRNNSHTVGPGWVSLGISGNTIIGNNSGNMNYLVRLECFYVS
jgi:hypothetical protein